MKSLVGTWKLKAFEIIKDEKSFKPFGNKVDGLLIYLENGYMSGIISGEGRPDVTSPAAIGISEQERAAISKNFIAYAGKYRIKDDIVIYKIEVSFIPNLMHEKSHKNTFKLEGRKLTTISKPDSLDKDGIFVVLHWERIYDKKILFPFSLSYTLQNVIYEEFGKNSFYV